jgi:hypothetical protein
MLDLAIERGFHYQIQNERHGREPGARDGEARRDHADGATCDRVAIIPASRCGARTSWIGPLGGGRQKNVLNFFWQSGKRPNLTAGEKANDYYAHAHVRARRILFWL